LCAGEVVRQLVEISAGHLAEYFEMRLTDANLIAQAIERLGHAAPVQKHDLSTLKL
jgi:hypothetical protein